MIVKEPANAQKSERERMVIDKQWLREQFAEMDARDGFVVDPSMTIEKMRGLMLASGIRPEDNVFSREILRDRYPDDFPLEQSNP